MNSNMSNDTRGWIMCVISGVACIVGSSIICIDILVRLIPSKADFRIQDSSAFLAASMSLSFGVMIFSALYSILPSSKKYLLAGDFSGQTASWVLVGCFAGGFVGIQIVSRFLHHYMPSHVVDCDHNHTEVPHENFQRGSRAFSHASHPHQHSHSHRESHNEHHCDNNREPSEDSPLLSPADRTNIRTKKYAASLGEDVTVKPRRLSAGVDVRPSMIQVQKRVMSFVKDTRSNCDECGPCFGYSEPCGQECFKHIGSKMTSSRRTTLSRPGFANSRQASFVLPAALAENRHTQDSSSSATSASLRDASCHSTEHIDERFGVDWEDAEAQHHHHVPENAFMAIGLQTSIAIALHKLPEGFITYATNHANPTLGLSVFLALFIHNITEGFALALPLYLALDSRMRAMLWASLLGGVSQPLGAGIAAIWFKVAGHGGHNPNSIVYGCMFGVTGGIMTSVALQLFVESLSLNHNRNLCIAFAFVGMAIMGISHALTSS